MFILSQQVCLTALINEKFLSFRQDNEKINQTDNFF